MSKELKYNIDLLLKKFPYEDHAKLIKLIPAFLNIKESTFFKWKATQLSDSFEIPEGKFQMLCDMFEVTPSQMRLYKTPAVNIKSILNKQA
jgi:hypothetical protein